MPGYGFRLFKMDMVKRDARTALEWDCLRIDGRDTDYLSNLRDILSDAQGSTEFGYPLQPGKPELTDADRRVRPAFRVEDVQEVGSRALLVRIRYGRHKNEDLGVFIGQGEAPDTPLTDLAPTRSYRALVIPPEVGTVGVLAVESIGGACPVKYLLRWVRRWNYDRASAGANSSEWYKLRAYAAADPSLLRRYVRQAEMDGAVLIRRDESGSRLRADEVFRIEAAIRDSSKENLRELATGVLIRETEEVDGDRDDVAPDSSELERVHAEDSQFAAAMAEALGSGLDGLSYDDGYLVLDTESGREHISPSRVPEVFTYPVSTDWPEDQTLLEEVKKRVLSIRRGIGATIDVDSW